MITWEENLSPLSSEEAIEAEDVEEEEGYRGGDRGGEYRGGRGGGYRGGRGGGRGGRGHDDRNRDRGDRDRDRGDRPPRVKESQNSIK